MATPTRQTSEADLNQFNIALRSMPWYQEFYQRLGLNPSGNGNRKLSRSEQSQIEALMARNGMKLPSGMHIDSGGSVNQKNRLGRNVAIGAAATGAALTGFGLAGMGPLSGLGGGAAATGAGASGAGAAAGGIPTIASTTYPTLAAAGPSLAGASTLGGGTAMGGAAAAGGGGALSSLAKGAASQSPNWMNAAIAGLAGLPGLISGSGGPSQDEVALQAQIQRLLQQQEARTNYSTPLYEAAMQSAYDLLPKRSGNYPGGS